MGLSPKNYILSNINPAQQTLAGAAMGQGLVQQAESRGLAQDANARAQAQEARREEMHPLQMQQAQMQINAAQQQLDAQAAQMRRRDAFNAQYGELIRKGTTATFEDFANLNAQFPELAKGTMEFYESMDENRQKPLVSTLAQAATALKNGNVEVGIKVAEDLRDAAQASGDAQLATMVDAAVKLAKADPDAAYGQIGTLLYQVDPDLAKGVLGSSLSGTAASVRATEILPDGTIIQSTDTGPAVYTAGGARLQGEEADAKIKEARQFGVEIAQQTAAGRETGKLETQADLAAAASGAKKAGEISQQKASEAFDTIGKTRLNIANIDRAINALDAGAKSGVVAKWFPDITTASAELNNAMNSMGLDVIGSVTFGALSEGEMNLAMNTAVPRNLAPDELREWLLNKRAAQVKAMDALTEAATYLSKPGNTLNTWLERDRPQEQPADNDLAFVKAMQAKKQRGEAFTPEEVKRIQQISGGGQ